MPTVTVGQSQLDNLFAQIEALMGLNLEIQPEHSLPKTRGWAASPDALLCLARHALSRKPERIVECSSGVSTLVLARCAQRNGKGHVFSLEHDAAYAEKTRAELARLHLTEWATVIHAPLTAHVIDGETHHWYALDQLDCGGPIDFLSIDGPPAGDDRPLSRYPALPKLYDRFQKEAYVFLDDYGREGEQRIVAAWQQQYPALTVESLPCEKGAALIHVRRET